MLYRPDGFEVFEAEDGSQELAVTSPHQGAA
jgi:hypothetical protein